LLRLVLLILLLRVLVLLLCLRGFLDLFGSLGGLLHLGMALVLVAQVVQATQVVVEEKLLKDVNLPVMKIVGYEGVWGTAVMLPIFAVMYYIPGKDAGSFENITDSFLKLENSRQLLLVTILYTFCCMSYNLCAVCVTGALSAVHRTMFMALRTLIVWVVDLGVHYLVDPTSSWGETWSVYSWLELAGFIVLVCGQIVYAGMVELPGFNYAASPVLAAAAMQPNYQSPSAMKLNSPCLPPPAEEEYQQGDFIKLVEEQS
jgi:hypothetical protein